MSTLQAKINAKRWFELAIKKNKLADFIIGLPPYAEHRPDDGELPMPVLVPNVEILYDYHKKTKRSILTPKYKTLFFKLQKTRAMMPMFCFMRSYSL